MEGYKQALIATGIPVESKENFRINWKKNNFGIYYQNQLENQLMILICRWDRF